MNPIESTLIPKQAQVAHRNHQVTATDRREITVTGVSEVLSFDETLVRLSTLCGLLNLEGEGLRVQVLDLVSGTVAVSGQLNGLLYEDAASEDSLRTERNVAKGKGRFRRSSR